MIHINYYEGGLMTLSDDTGVSIKITQSELYEPLRSFFDKHVNDKSSKS